MTSLAEHSHVLLLMEKTMVSVASLTAGHWSGFKSSFHCCFTDFAEKCSCIDSLLWLLNGHTHTTEADCIAFKHALLGTGQTGRIRQREGNLLGRAVDFEIGSTDEAY